MTEFDWEAARRSFPILQRRNYMASHAIGPMPLAAEADLAEYNQSLASRVAAVPLHLERMEEVRGLLSTLLGVAPETIALCPSATAAQAVLGMSLATSQDPQGIKRARRRILVSLRSFPSSRFVWEALGRLGFEVIPIEEATWAERDTSQIADRIDERVLAVAPPWVTPRTGALIDVGQLSRACRRHGALLVLDGYQGLGSVPLSLSSSQQAQGTPEALPHVVVGGVHKGVCGASMGLALLYVEPALSEALSPAQPGWLGSSGFPHFTDEYAPAVGAMRFQQGTPAVEPIFGARAGLRFLLDTGVARLRARSLTLTGALIDLAVEAGLDVLTPRAAAMRGGTVALDVAHVASPDQQALTSKLAAQGLDVDIRPGALRISPHPCAALDDSLDAMGTLRGLIPRKI